MAKQQFDLIAISFGYKKYAVPRDVGMALFNTLVGHDVYEIEQEWYNGNTTLIAKLVGESQLPTLSTLGPVAFHTALEAHRALEERKAADKAAKEAEGR